MAVINQRGERYELKRDALGRIVEETDYWGQSRHYQYDACGRLTATIDPLGQRIAFATDALGRIVRKTLPDVRAPGQQVQEQRARRAGPARVQAQPDPYHFAWRRQIVQRRGAHGRNGEESLAMRRVSAPGRPDLCR